MSVVERRNPATLVGGGEAVPRQSAVLVVDPDETGEVVDGPRRLSLRLALLIWMAAAIVGWAFIFAVLGYLFLFSLPSF